MRTAKHNFKATAFQLYAKEFLQDEAVIAMDLEAVGAYIILLCHQWNEQSVPADPTLLARICRTTPDRLQAIWSQVAPKFAPLHGNEKRLANPKLEMIRKESGRFSKKQAEYGKRGAAKRWANKPLDTNSLDGVPQPAAIAAPLESAMGFDSSGSGTGSVYIPPSPFEKGGGVDAQLILTPPDSTTNIGVTEKRLPYQAMLEQVAHSIHGRRPSTFGRRDLGVAAVEKKLRAILKHKQTSVKECEEYLRRIDENHAAICATESWQRDGGQFAKSLRNYLSPTEERYEIETAVLQNGHRHEPPRIVL
jgi:uncharacterized protein YdaU (DUF1376 family)